MTSKITDVTVYLNGAQLTRSQSFVLQKGANTIVFDDLPTSLNPQSVTAAADHNVLISSVTYSVASTAVADTSRVSALELRLRALQEELTLAEGLCGALEAEEGLLLQNCQIQNGKTFTVEAVKGVTSYFRERMADLGAQKLEAKKKREDLQNEIAHITTELGILDNARHRSVVELELYSPEAVQCPVTLTYYVYAASWTPYYDIRVTDIDSPVTIEQKGNVSQQTGEDWTNVTLTLSTGNPALGGELPQLNPWYVDFYTSSRPYPGLMVKRANMSLAQPAEAFFDEAVPAAVAVAEIITNVEYTLPSSYTILTSAKEKAVDIQSHCMPAEYMYHSIPKLEKDVFLVATIRDWEHLGLLAGAANIFYEGKYVGASYIDPTRAEDHIRITLGRDPNIAVTRIKGRDFSGRSFTGANIKASREWVLTVKNQKQKPIRLQLEDQLPVSTNKLITVDAVNASDAEWDKDKGLLKWILALEPAASKVLNIKYTVTYPSDQKILLE